VSGENSGSIDTPPVDDLVIKTFDAFRQILLGLHHVHDKGIIHRDLKPGNVFVFRSGNNGGDNNVGGSGKNEKNSSSNGNDSSGGGGEGENPIFKIGDFGLSKLVEVEVEKDNNNENNNTETPKANNNINRTQTTSTTSSTQSSHTVGIGTVSYAAPEQIERSSKVGDYGLPVDIYSLGLILLELFCGFQSEHERARAFHAIRYRTDYRHESDSPAMERKGGGFIGDGTNKVTVPTTDPTMIELAQTFPEVSQLVWRCTEVDPSKRPTIQEILEMSIFRGGEVSRAEFNILEKSLQQKDRELLEKDKLIRKLQEELQLKNE